MFFYLVFQDSVVPYTLEAAIKVVLHTPRLYTYTSVSSWYLTLDGSVQRTPVLSGEFERASQRFLSRYNIKQYAPMLFIMLEITCYIGTKYNAVVNNKRLHSSCFFVSAQQQFHIN